MYINDMYKNVCNGINFVPRKIVHGFEEIGVNHPDLTPSKHLIFKVNFFAAKMVI